MNNRQLEIRDFILSLAHKTLGIKNKQIASLLDEYVSDTIRSIPDIKTEIQTKMLEFSKEISNRGEDDNLFSTYGIYNEEDLLSFIKENKEHGFYSVKVSPIHQIPLGGIKENSLKNKINTYDDRRIVSLLQENYSNVPSYEKENKTSLSDIVDISSFYLLRENWMLQDYKDTLRYMIGLPEDYLELSATFLEQQGFKVQRYQFASIRNPHENHLFLGYEKNGKWYYFESLFEPFQGIYEFSSKEEMEQVIMSKYLTYYTVDFNHELKHMEDLSKDEMEKYQRAMELQDKAIYDHRLSLTIDEENPKFSAPFKQSCYEKWMESLSLLENIPKVFELYQLKRLRKPEPNSSYYAYQSYLYYQPKVSHIQVNTLYQREQSLLKFACSGILTPGILSKKDGIYHYKEIEIPARFSILEPIKREQQFLSLLHQYEFQLCYHSVSSGRSVIRLDGKGGFEQIKGVDLLEIKSNIYQYPLSNMKNAYALRVTPSKEIQFRGMSSYDDLYCEKTLHEQFLHYDFLCPTDIELNDFNASFLEQNRLPKMQEDPKEYISRVGLSIRLTPEMIEEFSSKFKKGIRFGQVKRHVLNPFRIADVDSYLKDEKVEQVRDILTFSCTLSPDTPNVQSYLLYFAKTLGTQLSILFNQNYFYQMRDTTDDITLSGEIVDDKFLSYYDALEEIDEKRKKDKKIDYDLECKKLQFSYFFQFFALSKSLKVLFDAFSKTTKRNIETPTLITFLGCFFGGLSYEKQDEFFQFYISLKESNDFMKMLKSIFPEEYNFIRENKTFFRNMLSILDDFSRSPQKIVDKTQTILKDQDFLNTVLNMKTEDRFVTYLKRRFKDSNLSLENLTLEQICDDSKIGILIRKEPIMVHSIATLIDYKLDNMNLFLEIGHDLIEMEKTNNLYRREELSKKLSKYHKIDTKHKDVVVLDLGSEEEISATFIPTDLSFSSGMATPLYLIFVLLGTSCIVFGVILSFIL